MSYAPSPKPRPHGAMYLVPVFVWILFSVGACVGGGVKAFTGLGDDVDALEDVSVSEGGSVDLEKREYIVYYEESGGDSDVRAPSIGYEIRDPSGQNVPVSVYSGDLEYATGNKAGVAIGTFEAEEAGTYDVVITDAPAIATGGRLAMGGNVLAGAKDGLLIFLIVGTAGFIVALVLFIVIARKRGNSKRQMQQSFGGGYPPPGGGYDPSGGQPAYGAPASYPPAGGYGAPGSYPPAGGYGAPGSFPPQQPGGYQQPPGGYPPPG